MKLKKAVLFIFLTSMQTLFAGLPFGPEWNLTDEKVHGAVKTIRTVEPTQTLVDQYNENRQLISRQCLTAKGSLKYGRACKYSLFGEMMSVSQFKLGGTTPEFVETATYLLPKQIASLKQSGPEGAGDAAAKTAEFEYEERQLKAIWMQTPSDDSVFAWEFSYHPDGVLQSWKYLKGQTCIEETIFKMNAQGDPECIELYAAQGKKIGEMKYEYRYDENGNWIRRVQRFTQYEGVQAVEKAPSTTRRKIEYYGSQPQAEPARRPAPSAAEFRKF